MKTTVGNIVKFYEKYPELIGCINVKTRFGYKKIEAAAMTAKHSEVLQLTTECGKQLKVSPDHLMLNDNNWISSKNLSIGDNLHTEDGKTKLIKIDKLSKKEDLYDLQVRGVKEFYANGLVSHNSTIIDVITFALYGKPFRKISKNGLLNSINKSDLIVELEFIIGTNNFKIIRGIKPNKFEIWCNDVLVKQEAKAKDYQEYLELYILKMDYKSFTQVCILGSARYVPFMQLTAADRRSVIEDVLDIQIFSSMNLVVKDKLSFIKSSLQTVKNQIELLNEKISLQQYNIESQKRSTTDLIHKKQHDIDTQLLEIETLQKQIEELQSINNELLDKITDTTKVQQKQLKLHDVGVKIKDNATKLSKEIDFYESHDNCPTCKQKIDEELKSDIITQNNKKIEELRKGKEKLSGELADIKSRLTEISVINGSISNNNIQISSINSTIRSIQKYVSSITKEIEEIQTDSGSVEHSIKKLEEFNLALQSNLTEYEDLIRDKSYYDFIALMLKDGGIKTNIIKQYLPILNKYINQYLKQMNFFVNFNIDENFEEVIKSRHRDEFTYANFSEGQKTRLDICLLLAFRQLAKIKNSVNTNLLILDEILDSSLDSEGTDVLVDIITNFDSDTNIIVISHNTDQISHKFERLIEVNLVKNFSKLKVI